MFLKIFYSFIFREREKEGERNISVWLPLTCPLLGTWPATQALTELNWRPFGSQAVFNPLSHTSQGLYFLFF